METSPPTMIDILEAQAAEVISCIAGIESLKTAYDSHAILRDDSFLFDTVYQSLWYSAIVRIGAIWDTSKRVASLPKLSKELRSLGSDASLAVARDIDGPFSAELKRLREWRHAIVSHSRFPLDPVSFNKDFELNLSDLEQEAERIEQLLTRANDCLGRVPVYYPELRERAATSALASLARWSS